jgi:hypothetical protein
VFGGVYLCDRCVFVELLRFWGITKIKNNVARTFSLLSVCLSTSDWRSIISVLLFMISIDLTVLTWVYGSAKKAHVHESQSIRKLKEMECYVMIRKKSPHPLKYWNLPCCLIPRL